MDRVIIKSMIGDFENYLRSDEKSENTIEKYLRDVRTFTVFAEAREISKSVVMEFKASLVEKYEVASANSMIAAVNAFLRFMGWMDCCIKQFKVQKKVFCSEEKELTKAEYIRLVNAAKEKGNERLNLILQTICGTGIRVRRSKIKPCFATTAEFLKKQTRVHNNGYVLNVGLNLMMILSFAIFAVQN